MMIKKLPRLATEFDDLHKLDVELPMPDRYGSGLVVAFRAWEFSLFTALRRNLDDKFFPGN